MTSTGHRTENALLVVSVYLVFLALGFDMGGALGIREPVLLLCLPLILLITGFSVDKYILLAACVLVPYPVICLMHGLGTGADLAVAFSQFKATFFGMVLMVALRGVGFERLHQPFFNALLVVGVFSIVFWMFLWLGVPGSIAFADYLANREAGYFGLRGAAEGVVVPNVYFKATLFYVPAFIYFYSVRKYWCALVMILALLAGVSKAGVAFCLLGIGMLAMSKLSVGKLVSGLILGMLAVFLVVNSPLWFFFEGVISGGSETVNIRVGHAVSLYQLWSEYPLQFLFGQGLGAAFYSEGALGYVTNIELDHLDVIRKYGIVWAGVFFMWVMACVFTAISSKTVKVTAVGWALLFSFMVTGTNPVLLSPVFFVLLLITMLGAEGQGVERI